MRIKKIKLLLTLMCLAICLTQIRIYASASDGEDYITISVDASDDNGNLKYAIDTDDPAAFSDSNEFRIQEGTSHTIYVQDVAGNITSQTYSPYPSADNSNHSGSVTATSQVTTGNEPKINIEVEIGDKQDSSNTGTKTDYSNYEYLTDEPIEPGGATVAEKIKTDSSDDAEKVFYTFQTKEGETLYLVIDQGQSADNVYLLDTVSINDLAVLADGKAPEQVEAEDNLLSALSKSADDNMAVENTKNETKSSNSNLFIILFVVVAFGGVYYYFKIYKPKKEAEMDIIDDAMDMDEFEAESDDEEAMFEEIDDAEKEAFLEQLINDEKDLYDANPDEYATSHMEMEDYADNDSDFEMEFPEDDMSEFDDDTDFSEETFGIDEEDGEEM